MRTLERRGSLGASVIASVPAPFVSTGSASAWQPSVAFVASNYDDETDAKSLRRYLAAYLNPASVNHRNVAGSGSSGGGPYIYYNPDPEGQFERPSVTIRTVSTTETLPTVRRAYNSSYAVRHSLVLTVYGMNRASTMALASQVFDLLNGGDPQHPPWRIPVFNFQVGVKVARFLRLLPGSLSMGLDETDDLNRWYRPVELQLDAPRTRGAVIGPVYQSFTTEITGA
jgi:hypothetical protein